MMFNKLSERNKIVKQLNELNVWMVGWDTINPKLNYLIINCITYEFNGITKFLLIFFIFYWNVGSINWHFQFQNLISFFLRKFFHFNLVEIAQNCLSFHCHGNIKNRKFFSWKVFKLKISLIKFLEQKISYWNFLWGNFDEKLYPSLIKILNFLIATIKLEISKFFH